MSESLVGLIDPATRHMLVTIVPIGGGNKVPAGTMAATPIVVSGRRRLARLSHEAGAAPAPGDERAAAANKANTKISLSWTFIRPPPVETWTDRRRLNVGNRVQ